MQKKNKTKVFASVDLALDMKVVRGVKGEAGRIWVAKL